LNEQFILDRYNDLFNEVKNINTNIKNLQTFFDNEKKEQELQEQEQKKIDEKQQKQLIEDKKKSDIKQQKADKQQQDFYSNIETIASNTNTEVIVSNFKDVSTLLQVNIVAIGLLIGIICISLFARYFSHK
jgi:predicted lipoprotein